MLVICYGIAKSGSTLAYELVKGVLASAGQSQRKIKSAGLKPRGRGNHLDSVERAHLAELINTIGPERIIAAKTHKCFDVADFEWLEEQQAARKLQVITSYRDPRDMCLSLVDHGERSREAGRSGFARIGDLERAAQLIKNAIPKFAKWSSLKGAMHLYYETVAYDPDDAIDAIEACLGVTGDHAEAKFHAFETAFTQKNKVKRNRYVDEMSEDQKAQMLETFGEFIERVCQKDDPAWFSEYRARVLSGEA